MDAANNGLSKIDENLMFAREEVDRLRAEYRQLSTSMDSNISKILDCQAKEAEEKVIRSRHTNRLLAILIAGMGSGGIGTAYFVAQRPGQAEITQPLVDSLRASESSLGARVEESEKKIQKLGEAVVEQQVQISDGFEFIADKIDAAHPRQKNEVDIGDYPAVEAAKKKSDAIKMKKGVDRLFQSDL